MTDGHLRLKVSYPIYFTTVNSKKALKKLKTTSGIFQFRPHLRVYAEQSDPIEVLQKYILLIDTDLSCSALGAQTSYINCSRAKVVGFIASRLSCEFSLTGVKILREISREKAQKKAKDRRASIHFVLSGHYSAVKNFNLE